MNAPQPPNERDRLAALRQYEVLDTPAEDAYDDLTLLVAQICQVPMAQISLVDEARQWFKSRVGLTASETPRDIAFCAHTILMPDEVMEVPDAQADPRFVNSPLVQSDPHIRFYAGAPLVTSDGYALGALCVMDRVPRKLTEEQRAALRALSRRVVEQLELRRQARKLANEVAERHRAETKLREQNDRLVAAEKAHSRMLEIAERSRRALLGILEDEKRGVERLRESEARFRQLAENITEVFWMNDVALQTIIYVSPAYETIWGRTCASLYVDPDAWLRAVHVDDRARVGTAVRNVGQAAAIYDEVYRILRPDGTTRWIHDRGFPVRNAEGNIYRIVGTAADVTRRKTMELRGTVQHAIARILSESHPVPETATRMLEQICTHLDWEFGTCWIVDGATRALRCVGTWQPPGEENASFAEVSRSMTLGNGEGIAGEVWQRREARWVRDVSKEKFYLRRATAARLNLRSAFVFPVMLGGEVFGVGEVVSRQVREPDAEEQAYFGAVGAQIGQFIERKRLEERFRQAQKMEAIGTLAGGIAHDFNNVLAAIGGYTELARMESQEKPEVVEHLDAVLHGARRAADLVRQILAFSRVQEQQRKPIQLWAVVDEALKLLRATIPTTIRFDTSLVRQGPAVLADATQIHQIVMNLATNASHAIKDRPGRLEVILENIEVEPDLAEQHPGLRPGPYVRLGVSDTGHGMEEITLSRIFDPFFTTKAPGEGTGLGLAVVHGIVQSHDGVITVYSQPGEGTRFHLYFPALASAAEIVAKTASEPARGRGERVLFVDDEKPLALMGQKMLERLGYKVTAFCVPAEALAAVETAPGTFDIVVTDLTMPGLTGTDLAQRIAGIRADLPVLLTTGYSANLTPERLRVLGISEMLLKPLTVQALAEAMRRTLTKPQETTL